MLTKGNAKFRSVKYVAVVLALIAVLALCFTSCGSTEVADIQYVQGSLVKAQYNAGETFDCTGAKVKVTYSNGDVTEVAVTSEMVGNVVLSVGMTSVEANHTEGGKTYVCAIPVSVVDPYANDRTAAISDINTYKTVTDNANDRGIGSLITVYVNKVNVAVSKEEITTHVAKFKAEVDAYIEGKQAARDAIEAMFTSEGTDGTYKFNSDVEGDELDGKLVYKQFALGVLTTKKDALATINTAVSIEAAEAAVDTFREAIQNTITEQTKYEDTAADNGQAGIIESKINLLHEINRLMTKAQTYKELLQAHQKDEVKLAEYMPKYVNALNDLGYWQEYVRLAINLAGISDAIEEIDEKLRTPVDDIYDLVKDGHTVKPAPYKFGDNGVALKDENGNYIIDKVTAWDDAATKDVTGKLLLAYDHHYALAIDQFGVEAVEKMLRYYEYDVTGKNEIAIVDLIDLIKGIKKDGTTNDASINEKYKTLTTEQDAAKAADAVIEKIDAAVALLAKDTATLAEIQTAIANAWNALYTWGKDMPVLNVDAALVAEVVDEVLKGTDGVNFAEVIKYKGTLAPLNGSVIWNEYGFDQTEVKTGYVPNYEDLGDTEKKGDEAKVLLDVSKIYPVVLAEADELLADGRKLDAKERLEAAQASIEAYKAKYAATYDKVIVEAAQTAVTAGKDLYEKQVALADKVNAAVAGLDKDAITIAMFTGDDNGNKPLYVAYESYLQFADINSYQIVAADGTLKETVRVLSPIEKAGENNDVDNKAKLIECMKSYMAKEFDEATHVSGVLKIYVALDIRLNGQNGQGGIDKNTQTELRKAFTDGADAMVAELGKLTADWSKIDANGFNCVKITGDDGVVAAVQADITNFALSDNLTVVDTFVAKYVDVINNADLTTPAAVKAAVEEVLKKV